MNPMFIALMQYYGFTMLRFWSAMIYVKGSVVFIRWSLLPTEPMINLILIPNVRLVCNQQITALQMQVKLSYRNFIVFL